MLFERGLRGLVSKAQIGQPEVELAPWEKPAPYACIGVESTSQIQKLFETLILRGQSIWLAKAYDPPLLLPP